MSEHYNIIILGSGRAGFTAGIYSSRASRSTLILEGPEPGGQLTTTTEVENYPGFENGIQGPEMMDIFRNQAKRFGAKSVYEVATKVDFSQKPFRVWSDAKKEYTSDAIIIATGAKAKLLDIPSEKEYWGFGISGCATCDGFFYKNKNVIVVGGGDTAMEDAIYLTHFANKVSIVHRRQGFRASQIMLDRAKSNPKIDFILDSIIDEYLGKQEKNIKSLTGVKLRNTKTGEISEMPIDGVFLAIGHSPNTEIFKGIIELDENGYIITKGKSTYTNIEGVFACGDVQDHVYRQAVTAAGTGCAASIDADRWLSEKA